jgi:hypothetical protein
MTGSPEPRASTASTWSSPTLRGSSSHDRLQQSQTSQLKPNADGTAKANRSSDDTEREVRRAEQEAEEYGEDEPTDPPPKAERGEQEHDPNEVGWDGPNDLDNPQNWSQGMLRQSTFLGRLR